MVRFEEAPRGYHKGQVEEYLTSLSGEYQKLLDELKAAQKKQEMLETELEHLRHKKGSMVIQTNGQELAGSEHYVEAIVSALVTAEVTAKQVIKDAHTEAGIIAASASEELLEILQAKSTALHDLRKLSGRLSEMLNQLEEPEESEEQSDEKEVFEIDNKCTVSSNMNVSVH